jgi:cyclopropane-fatty-acyl-phospholipid synthase
MKTFARQIILNLLKKLHLGRLTLLQNNQEYHFGASDAQPHVTVTVRSNKLFNRILFFGTNGAAYSFIQGEWETNDLTALIEIILMNQSVFATIDNRFSGYLNRLVNLWHGLQKNYKKRSKKNILQHYDLGNDFFNLILDKKMMYSSGVYPHDDATLEEASIYKLERVAAALQLSPSDHILEIGSGWGGFAIFAAQRYGCKVTTTTISDRQHAYVRRQVQLLGLDKNITVLNKDYRDLKGTFDKVVSIEMIEAVGHQFFTTFFRQCNSLLKPGGLFFLQAITINDTVYTKAKNEIDFIKKYIFPGGCLPSMSVIKEKITRHTSLQLLNWEDIGSHYFHTLMDWRARFYANLETIRALGFSETFLRTWDFYFCYCAAGFQQAHISNIQGLWRKNL